MATMDFYETSLVQPVTKKEKSPIVKKELFKMAARWLFWFGAFAQIGNPYTHWFFDEQEFGYNGTVAVIA